MNIDVLYVVYEDTTNFGGDITVVGVYSSKTKAEKKASQSRHYHIDESYVNIIEET